jgi:23S rRNA pseudouridine2604 synthase
MIKPQKPARAAPASPSRPSRPPRQAAQPAAPAEQAGERLSKRVAFVMRCSRREAEQYIEGGWVKVDGRVVEEPMARVAEQAVVVDPHASLMGLTEVTLLLHKPTGLDTMALPGQANKHVKPAHTLLQAATHTTQDESGNRVLKRHFAKLTACVPLENGASGLVVFTQDWRVLRKLTDDAAIMEHEVLVEVKGEVPPEALHWLNTPPASEKDTLPAVKVSVNSTSETSTRLRFAFKGSHPGLIAYLCERLDLHILSMKRLRVGRVTLAHLPEGQWRYLQAHERF